MLSKTYKMLSLAGYGFIAISFFSYLDTEKACLSITATDNIDILHK